MFNDTTHDAPSKRASVRNTRGFLVGLIVALIGSMGVIGVPALGKGLTVYWTQDADAADAEPPGQGWNELDENGVPVAPGGSTWLGFNNCENGSLQKWLRVELVGLNAKALEIEAEGFQENGDAVPDEPYGFGKKGQLHWRGFVFQWCPEWERVKLTNNTTGAITVQVEAWSKCAETKPKNIKTVAIEQGSYGAPGAMNAEYRMTELMVFPRYEPVDQNATHAFSAPQSTGSWTTDVVFVDPDGNPMPQGGIRWTSDGDGLRLEDEYSLELVMLQRFDLVYTVFALDAESGEYAALGVDLAGPPWFDPFDNYDPGDDLIGNGRWQGWDDDSSLDAIIAPNPFLSPPHSVDVQNQTNAVRLFDAPDCGTFFFQAWTYVPQGFQSGGNDPQAGSHLRLLDTYQHDGPRHVAADMQFDSNGQQLKVYAGDPNNTVDVPYIVDQWVPIDVIVDLENDFTAVFYDQQFICEYQWTAGAFGDGNGQPQIAAVELWARGSSSIFYDDLVLEPMEAPVDFTGFDVTKGTHLAGSIADLWESDDTRVDVRSEPGFFANEPNLIDLSVFGWTPPQQIPYTLTIEDKIDHPAGTGKARLRNWSSGQFEEVGQYAISTQEATHTIDSIDMTNFIRADDGAVELSLKHIVFATFSPLGFKSSIDLVRIKPD